MRIVWGAAMSSRSVASFALVGCLFLACGGKVGGSPGSGSSGSSSGASSGGTSSGGTSSGGGSSSGVSSGGTSSSGVSSGSSSGSATCVDIQASSYDTSCNSVSDCFLMQVGTICDGTCACGNFAANVSGQAQYEQALSEVQLSDCFCPDAPIDCIGHQCTTAGAVGVDASAPPPDSGTCVDIDLSTYDTSCNVSSDCIEITAGTICSGSCACGGATINVADEGRYDAAISGIQTGACPCPAELPPSCVAGKCVFCGFGPNSPPGCPDAG